MFLRKEDLGNKIYDYQIEQITEGDNNIVLQAMSAAEQEVKSYLQPNNKKEYLDGRLRYDIDAVFSATGNERNAIILNHTITIAKWYIVELSNADILYERARDRYDRAVSWLTKLAKGTVNLSDLPTIDDNPNNDNSQTQSFVYGSRKKFNHE